MELGLEFVNDVVLPFSMRILDLLVAEEQSCDCWKNSVFVLQGSCTISC